LISFYDRLLLNSHPAALVLLAAAALDYAIADPWHWWHPVQGMGWAIARYTDLAHRWLKSPLELRLAGLGLGLGLILGSGAIAGSLIYLATRLHPWLGIAGEIILLASCFAGRSLRHAAEDVLRPLETGDLETARDRLRRYVGRDTAHLNETEILRAILETVAENATDGVLAPLFYAMVGAFLPLGSVPLAIAYKAASTLDSMVGYKTPPYKELGWFSARTEDVLTWIPCRLVVLTLSLLSGRPMRVWRLCRRDAPQDPSPNSGWSECAYAAVLGVQLGGVNWYQGVEKRKPLLGDDQQPITPDHIRRALQLTRWCFLIWLIAGIALRFVFSPSLVQNQ